MSITPNPTRFSGSLHMNTESFSKAPKASNPRDLPLLQMVQVIADGFEEQIKTELHKDTEIRIKYQNTSHPAGISLTAYSPNAGMQIDESIGLSNLPFREFSTFFTTLIQQVKNEEALPIHTKWLKRFQIKINEAKLWLQEKLQ